MSLFRFRRGPGRRPLVWAHRGARAHAPENTMLAFERGRADGGDGVELDVRTSRDGVVVVAHDPDLARVTSGVDRRRVAELTARELSVVALHGGGTVPTLAEVLDWADSTGMLVNVELKHDAHDELGLARAVGRLLRGRGLVAERVVLSSFQPRLLGLCRAFCPSVPRAFLVHERQRFARGPLLWPLAAAASVVAVHPERTLCSPAVVARLRRWGYLIHTWTVNDPAEARDLALLGVDGLITDDPATILPILNESRRLDD